jgi:glycosyltransferase involved in cell wall biosynthesis
MLVVVTPVKNEGKRLLDIANQLIAQTLVPDFWIIVDDNSADVTPNIIKQLEKDYDFILSTSLSKCSDYDEVSRYGHVVQAGFNHALDYCRELKFLGVLDADITLKKNHYEAVINAFNNVPRLGIASGLYIESRNDAFYSVSGNDQKLPICGAAMTFRKECLIDIGGFPTCPRPDTVSLLKAANRGWKIGVVSSTYVIHLRVKQSLDKYVRLGLASYLLGYHPVNALMSGPYLALRNLSLSPLGFTIGYMIGTAKANKVADEEVKHYFSESFLRRTYEFVSLLSHRNINLDPIENSTIRL